MSLNPRRRFSQGLAVAATIASLLSLPAAPSVAQGVYPDKPIRLLVGYNPGGGMDGFARLLAPRLSSVLGQPVVVENRSGAAGMIAAETVASAPADGYTLLLGESGLLITSIMVPRAGFDPLKSLAPVAGVFVAPLMVVANPTFPASDPRSLVAYLKANPGKATFGTPGVGTLHQLGFELLKAEIGAFVVHIPYRGASLVIPDVINGQVDLGVISAGAGIAQVQSGRLKGLAMMSRAKLPGTESIGAMADAMPGFEVAPQVSLLAPAATPAPVIARLGDAVRQVLQDPEVARTAERQGGIPGYLAAPQLADQMRREHANWSRVIKTQKISAQ